MLLQVSDMSVAYPAKDNVPVTTVKNVDFTLDEGETLAIVGESGSGKTTVIRAVMNCLPGFGFVSEGAIIFMGKDLAKLDNSGWQSLRGKEIAMIFQDSGNMMNPVRTIGSQYIEYIRTHTDLTKQAAHDLAVEKLSLMNLSDPENIMTSYTFELSGGMRQRVGIAMAITFDPKLLLADEPTSALDVTTQAQIVGELMYTGKGSGTAMIVVTHNIGVAATLSDKIMVMQKGQVVEYGSTDNILNAPQAAYTKTLLAAVPEIGGKRYV